MSITAAKGYLVRRLSEAPTVPCPCGQSTRPLTRADTPLCNLHVTFIKDSVKHYHKETTEVYLILEGHGPLELNEDVIDVERIHPCSPTIGGHPKCAAIISPIQVIRNIGKDRGISQE